MDSTIIGFGTRSIMSQPTKTNNYANKYDNIQLTNTYIFLN